MAIFIENAKVPESCWKCPASHYFDLQTDTVPHGYKCGFLNDEKIITQCEAKERRREDCPIRVAPAGGEV